MLVHCDWPVFRECVPWPSLGSGHNCGCPENPNTMQGKNNRGSFPTSEEHTTSICFKRETVERNGSSARCLSRRSKQSWNMHQTYCTGGSQNATGGGGRTRTHDSKAKTPEMNLMQWSFCSTTHQILCRVQGADDFTWSGFMVGFWVLG